jgi:FixJ family two-component response regulator
MLGTIDRKSPPRGIPIGMTRAIQGRIWNFDDRTIPACSGRSVDVKKSDESPEAATMVSTVSLATPTVFVVDDDVSVRESLELLIRCEGWQPKTYSSAQEFLPRHREPIPGCLLLDISLSGLNGLDVQKRVAADHPHMPIIFITGCDDVPTTVQAMKAGAFEFLTKPLNNDVLLSAMRLAIERSCVVLRRGLETERLTACYESLTGRERQVMALVASGLTNKQVGSELGINEITVKGHRGKVMRKMNADSLAELVKIAARLRIARAPCRIARRPE